jgi:hypothetical protein
MCSPWAAAAVEVVGVNTVTVLAVVAQAAGCNPPFI